MVCRVFLIVVASLLVGTVAWSAEIYGQLWGASKEVPVGARVSTSCGGEVEVDRYGRYRITGLSLRATCALSINYRNLQSNPVNIYTGSNRNGANFMLKVSGDRLLLIRR